VSLQPAQRRKKEEKTDKNELKGGSATYTYALSISSPNAEDQ
jgi:hypothetical protein